jgi:hypothetical protein
MYWKISMNSEYDRYGIKRLYLSVSAVLGRLKNITENFNLIVSNLFEIQSWYFPNSRLDH